MSDKGSEQLGREAAIRKLRELWDEPTALQKMGLPRIEAFQQPTETDEQAGTIVSHPPQFQPEPSAVGTDVGRALEQILRFAPALRGRIKNVQMGPSSPIFNTLRRTNYHPEDLPRLNLLGATDLRTGDIGLNPSTTMNPANGSDYSMPAVLAHEVTHAAGYLPEREPELARSIVNKLGGLSPLTSELVKRSK